jgi:alginate O-acetyltransferase complex protein AlgI
MLFSSYEYLAVFLPIVVVIFHWLKARHFVHLSFFFLTVMSFIFYAWWNPRDLPILLGSITINWWLGRQIILSKGSRTKQRWMFYGGCVANFLLLGYFKYAGFLVDNVNYFGGTEVEFVKPLLPLAISFFTFQQIAYLVDCFSGDEELFSFSDYALFVTFFPQFIAGPIVHHKEMMPQLTMTHAPGEMTNMFSRGLFRFSIGLFKKVILADTFAIWANAGFGEVDQMTTATAWITTFAYTLQLYFDFSGYSDMAIGSGLLFGIRLPENFNSPYRATDIKDFWRRWHITLGRWLRDYLYIPLGGNRNGTANMLFAITLTFVLGGLWHGASWTFIAWGALHGFAYVMLWAWTLTGIKMPVWTARLTTFGFIHLTWVFFRAKTFSDAMSVMHQMFDPVQWSQMLQGYGLQGMDLLPCGYEAIAAVIAGLGVVFFAQNSRQMEERFSPNFRNMVLFWIAMTAPLVKLTFHDDFAEFLYFNF